MLAQARTGQDNRAAFLVKWPGMLITIVFLAVVMLLWEGIVRTGHWAPYSLPSPATVLDQLYQGFQNHTNAWQWWKAPIPIGIGQSMKRMAIGYGVSLVLGVSLGIAIARFYLMERTVGVLVSGLQALPSITWLPLALIWFGLNDKAIIFVVVLGSLLAITTATTDGVKNMPTLYLRAARNLGANGPAMYLRVILPASLPSIITGMKLGWSFAWRSLMAAELLFVTPGLGQLLDAGRALNNIAQVMAIMVVIVVLGLVVDSLVFSPIERGVRRRWGLTGVRV